MSTEPHFVYNSWCCQIKWCYLLRLTSNITCAIATVVSTLCTIGISINVNLIYIFVTFCFPSLSEIASIIQIWLRDIYFHKTCFVYHHVISMFHMKYNIAYIFFISNWVGQENINGYEVLGNVTYMTILLSKEHIGWWIAFIPGMTPHDEYSEFIPSNKAQQNASHYQHRLPAEV